MSLLAGTAVRDLSPATPMQLCGYPHVRRISSGIHDPLLASLLFLRQGSSAVLLGALDLVMLNADFARRLRCRVAEAVGITEAGVLLSCTHTHSAPVTLDYLPFSGDVAMPPPDPAYLDFVEQRIIEAAREARRCAEPAELAWTSAEARGVGGNRHAPDGPTDPEAGVLVVRRPSAELLSVNVIYGMHPTVLHEDSTLVSADFPHYTRQQLREQFGENLVVLYHTGPAGNQSPRYHVTGQTFAEAERLGRKLGAAVATAISALCESEAPQSFDTEPVLAAALQTVDFPRRNFPSVAEAEQVLVAYRAEHARLQAAGAERAQVRTAEVSVFGAEALVRLAHAQASGETDRLLARLRPFDVQVLRLGATCLVAMPGEFFAEYALQLKARAVRQSFVATYANGELQGYIVTPEAAAAGGYEAASSMFAPAAGAKMIEMAVEMVKEL